MSILNLKFHIATTSTWHFTDFPNHLFFMFDFHQLSPIRITSSTTAVLASKRSIKVQKDLSLSILKSHFEVSTIATIHSGATIRFFFHDKKYSSILIKHIISIFVFPPTSNFQKPKLKCLKITQKVSFYNIASEWVLKFKSMKKWKCLQFWHENSSDMLPCSILTHSHFIQIRQLVQTRQIIWISHFCAEAT